MLMQVYFWVSHFIARTGMDFSLVHIYKKQMIADALVNEPQFEVAAE